MTTAAGAGGPVKHHSSDEAMDQLRVSPRHFQKIQESTDDSATGTGTGTNTGTGTRTSASGDSLRLSHPRTVSNRASFRPRQLSDSKADGEPLAANKPLGSTSQKSKSSSRKLIATPSSLKLKMSKVGGDAGTNALESAVVHAKTGTGLGLPICKQVREFHLLNCEAELLNSLHIYCAAGHVDGRSNRP